MRVSISWLANNQVCAHFRRLWIPISIIKYIWAELKSWKKPPRAFGGPGCVRAISRTFACPPATKKFQRFLEYLASVLGLRAGHHRQRIRVNTESKLTRFDILASPIANTHATAPLAPGKCNASPLLKALFICPSRTLTGARRTIRRVTSPVFWVYKNILMTSQAKLRPLSSRAVHRSLTMKFSSRSWRFFFHLSLPVRIKVSPLLSWVTAKWCTELRYIDSPSSAARGVKLWLASKFYTHGDLGLRHCHRGLPTDHNWMHLLLA